MTGEKRSKKFFADDKEELNLRQNAKKLGSRCSALFCNFVLWLINDCHKKEIKKVYFLMREGEFFKKVLEETGEDLKGVELHLLAVSRRSTFFASMDELSPTEWERLFSQYGDQPITALLKSLEVPYQETLEMFIKYGVDRQKSLKKQKDVFFRAIEHYDIKEHLWKQRCEARKGIQAYLGQMKLCQGKEKVAVVDIGWRGTIQDNLCKLFPEKMFYGYYFGMIGMLNPQPSNAVKQGYLNTFLFSEALIKSHTQMEMLCTSPMGTTLSYSPTSDEYYFPVFEANTKDVECWNHFAKFYQQGVLQNVACKRRCRIWEYWGILQISLLPNKFLAKAFFSFEYSEIFGLGKTINMNQINFSLKPFFSALKGPSGMHKLRVYLNNTMWPQGFLRIHNLTILIPIYNIILLLAEQRHEL